MKSDSKRTPAQQEAVMTTEEEVLLVAGPGSGKTKTTVDRIEKLIADGVDSKEIVVLTFTNAAAREIEDRLSVCPNCGGDGYTVEPSMPNGEPEQVQCPCEEKKRLGYVGTLHGFALRMLKEHGGGVGYGERISIIAPESAAFLLESKARSLACKTPLKKLLSIKAEGFADSPRVTVEQSVVALYLDELREAGIVDFDVLLLEFLRSLRNLGLAAELNNRFSYLFVDEVQDSAAVDWAIYRQLPMRWKFLCGDPDQSIFGFRGSAVSEMLRFAEEVGTHVIKLEENFRSRHRICEAANALIGHNSNRLDKRTRAVACGDTGIVSVLGSYLTEGEEIGAVARRIMHFREQVPAASIAVITRTNHLANAFRTTLSAGGMIPVVQREVSDLPRDWGFARSMIELLAQPDNDTLAFLSIVTKHMKDGATARAAGDIAHGMKVEAARNGLSINRYFSRVTRFRNAAEAAQSLGHSDVSLESRMLIAERLKELPKDASILDLALAMGQTRDVVETDAGKVENAVEVITIHGSKGREFDSVFLVGFEDEVIPGQRQGVDIEEERRLAFVAVTRARYNVIISSSVQRVTSWKEIVTHKPSRFLAELLPS